MGAQPAPDHGDLRGGLRGARALRGGRALGRGGRQPSPRTLRRCSVAVSAGPIISRGSPTMASRPCSSAARARTGRARSWPASRAPSSGPPTPGRPRSRCPTGSSRWPRPSLPPRRSSSPRRRLARHRARAERRTPLGGGARRRRDMSIDPVAAGPPPSRGRARRSWRHGAVAHRRGAALPLGHRRRARVRGSGAGGGGRRGRPSSGLYAGEGAARAAPSPRQLARALAERYGLDHIDLSEFPVDESAAGVLARARGAPLPGGAGWLHRRRH